VRPREEADRPRDVTVSPPPAGQPGSGLARDEAPGGPVRQSAEDAGNGRRRGRGQRGADRSMVPPAEFRSYYGRPVVRPAPWHHDIPAYLFTGGLAAGSALMAAGAQATGRPALRRAGRATALGALLASTYFLVHDLGRPDRFHHMLRVAKPTSPMSVGTWILSGLGAAAGAAAIAEAAPLLPRHGVLGLGRRLLPPVGDVAGYAAGALAPGLATYTAVLLAHTATPSWHAAYPDLPFTFAGSALASGAAAGLIAVPVGEAGPARRLAIVGAALELAGCHRVEHGHGLVSEPYRQGRAGRFMRAARYLTAAGAVGAVAGRRSRVLSALAGLSLLGGSLATRFGVFEGGMASARDPRYTVVPQRERLAERQRDAVAAGGQQLADDRMAGQFPGDQQAAGGLGVGE
jgi:Polysulphide reductase, NrfD